MATNLTPHLTAIWWQAVGSTHGLRVLTPDPVRLKFLLYSTRRRLAREELEHLTITNAPLNPTGELWILHSPLGVSPTPVPTSEHPSAD